MCIHFFSHPSSLLSEIKHIISFTFNLGRSSILCTKIIVWYSTISWRWNVKSLRYRHLLQLKTQRDSICNWRSKWFLVWHCTRYSFKQVVTKTECFLSIFSLLESYVLNPSHLLFHTRVSLSINYNHSFMVIHHIPCNPQNKNSSLVAINQLSNSNCSATWSSQILRQWCFML